LTELFDVINNYGSLAAYLTRYHKLFDDKPGVKVVILEQKDQVEYLRLTLEDCRINNSVHQEIPVPSFWGRVVETRLNQHRKECLAMQQQRVVLLYPEQITDGAPIDASYLLILDSEAVESAEAAALGKIRTHGQLEQAKVVRVVAKEMPQHEKLLQKFPKAIVMKDLV